ncbi:CHASE domain-containing protein [Litoribacillus peritrichatus]|uniref:histidine kinase n=1 Tax=Litoribacillus peritrichatus TaxID=718191 RepID=A0ABP7MBZ8_9GAMM
MTPQGLKAAASLHWFHWLVVSLSLLLTLAAWYISKTQTEEKLQQRFEFQSQQLLDLISERMSRYEDALRAGVAAINAQKGADVNMWKRFSETLHIHKSYPGINGIGVIYYISPNKLNNYLLKERELRPGYIIHPPHNKNEYWPITYVEPVINNEKAIGLDMAFESNRYQAALKARDLNVPQITAPIVLVQDSKQTPGFLQYVPFYNSEDIGTVEKRRKHFIGHVYAPFIMYKLMEGALAQKHRQLLFSVHDNNDVLYNELTSDNPYYDAQPLYQKTVSIDMYGRPWRFSIQTAHAFREGADTYQSTFILLGGIVIDSLLLFLFIALARSNKKAIEIAIQMTQKLSISEIAPCGILIINQKGIIEIANPHTVTLFGYSQEELEGKSIKQLIPQGLYEGQGNDHPQSADSQNTDNLSTDNQANNIELPFWDSIEHQTQSNKEVVCETQNGNLFPAEIGIAPFKHGEGSKFLATIFDMSSHVEMTNELKRSNKELNDFAYIASHDLKAPLRGIMQLSAWIAEDIEEIATEETKHNLTLLQNRTSRLEKLLDDLLAYSRLGRDLGKLQQVDIEFMVTSIFDLLDPPKGFKLVIQNEMPVFESLLVPLEVIFRNLISNAIKHHHKSEGTITISVADQAQEYEFSVCDDGPGINPKLHDRAFELFKTLKPRDEVEGSGMGLAFVKKMLKQHKSNIRIVSDGESGTCFIFTWPKKLTDV